MSNGDSQWVSHVPNHQPSILIYNYYSDINSHHISSILIPQSSADFLRTSSVHCSQCCTDQRTSLSPIASWWPSLAAGGTFFGRPNGREAAGGTAFHQSKSWQRGIQDGIQLALAFFGGISDDFQIQRDVRQVSESGISSDLAPKTVHLGIQCFEKWGLKHRNGYNWWFTESHLNFEVNPQLMWRDNQWCFYLQKKMGLRNQHMWWINRNGAIWNTHRSSHNLLF